MKLTTTPAPKPPTASPFVLDLLGELRANSYTIGAWIRFLHRSWNQSVEDVRSEAALARSCARQSFALAALALSALLWHWRRYPAAPRRRQILRAALLLVTQQGFVALHLGMTQRQPELPRFTSLGLPNFLTLLRGLCATLLVVAGVQDSPCFGTLVVTGGMTDALDGILARQTARCTRMGQMLDPMTDACFYSTMTSVAVRRGTLPWWGSWLLAVRFLAPVAAGAYRYFVWARPVDAAHTMCGKLSSVALITTIGVSAISIRAGRFCWWPTSLLVATAGALQLRRILPPGMQALDAPRHDLARLEKRLGNRSR